RRDRPPRPPGRRHRPRAGPPPGLEPAGARGPRGRGRGVVGLRALPVAAAGVLVGWGVGHWAAPQVLAALSGSSLARVNFRKRVLVAGLGLVLPLGLLVWAAPLAVAGRFFWRRAVQLDVAVTGPALGVVLAALAF